VDAASPHWLQDFSWLTCVLCHFCPRLNVGAWTMGVCYSTLIDLS
jgi:hypothetical protein